MASVNSVFIMGNLTRDPTLRKTNDGIAVADLGVAVSERYRNKEGKEVNSVCFTDVVAWGRSAEACAQFLKKGARVMVEGRLQYDQWENPKGEKRSKLRIRSHAVHFLGSSNSGNGKSSGPAEVPELCESTAGDPF